MKAIRSRILRPWIVLFTVSTLALAWIATMERAHTQTPPYPPNGTPADPNSNCDNGDPQDPSHPCCPEKDCNGDPVSDPEPDCVECSGSNHFSAYTGNVSRKISDLALFGSRGGKPLQFTRYSNTRMSPQNGATGRFGRDTVWTHSYQWYLRSGGTSGGQPALRLAYPQGGDVLFVCSASDPTQWLAPSSLTDRLVQNGNTWTLVRKGGENYVFNKYTTTTGSIFYRFESFSDTKGNAYAVSYSSATDTLPRKITDPSGRWLQINYSNLAALAQSSSTLGSVPYDTAQGAWQEIAVTNTGSYRFLALFDANDWHNADALPISEIEFYDQNNVKITGTPFGSDPYFIDDPNSPAAHEIAKAFDGDESSYYRYAYKRNGYIGIDAGTAKKVSRIRYFIPSGIVANTAAATFVGMTDNSTTTSTIKEVVASDGRKVTYNYSIFTDPSGFFNWQTLTTVNYPEGANALYSYAQQADFTRPVLVDALDEHESGNATHVSYQFAAGGILGAMIREQSGATGEAIAQTGFVAPHVTQAIYPNGKTVTYTYNLTNALLANVKDGNGNITSYTYDQNNAGYIASVTDPLGRVTAYTRNATGALLSATYADGTVESWTRDAQDRILTRSIAAVNDAARTTTYTRDAKGNIIRQDNPDGSFESWTLNAYGDPLTHTLVNGATESWTYNVAGLKTSFTDATGAASTYSYDALDLLASVTDALGRTTSYTRDAAGRITQTMNPDGTSTSVTYDDFGDILARADENGHFWSTQYDEFKRKISSTDPLGRTTTFNYGGGPAAGGCGACNAGGKPVLITMPNGRKIQNTYDLEWRLLTTTMAYGSSEAAVTTYTYDKAGNVLTVKDPISRTTSFVYDLRNRRVKTTFPGSVFRSTAYDGYGNVIAETDELGKTSIRTYGLMNELLTATDATARTTTYLYEVPGASATGHMTSVIQPSGRKSTSTYDALWRVTAQTSAAGTADAATAQTIYDAVGNAIQSVDAMNRATTNTFDVRNRRILTVDAAGRQWSYTYSPDSLLLTTTNPDSTVESRSYDAAHRLLTITDAGGRTTAYAYDLDDHVVKLTDPNGSITRWVFDLTGRNTAKLYADNTQDLFSYDPASQLMVKSRAGGQTATYSYDTRGRNTKVLWAGTSAPPQSTFTYDAANHLLTAVNSTATTTRTYDDAGRVLTDSQKITAASATPYTVGYGYDGDGRLASLVYPDGTTVGYDYNNRGELSSVTNGGPPPVVTYARNLDGSIASIIRENGVSTVNSYDNLGRLLGTSHGSPGVALGGEGYTLDAMSRRTSRTRPDGSVDTFGYDAAGEVTAASYTNNTSTQTFAYDLVGNRLQSSRGLQSASVEITNYTANALNQYTSVSSVSSVVVPTYNANGDLLTDGPRTYTWNGQSELTKVVSTTGGTQTSTFTYDAFHRRVSRVDAQGSTYFIHDGWNVIEEYKKVGTIFLASKRYTWGDDLSGSKQGAGGVGGLLMAEELLSTINQPLSTSVSYLYHFDGNGNVILITDATGQKAAEYQYDAFGRTLSATGTYAQTNRYRFSTKQVELGSGLYYYGYRFYDPENGRWPSRDLIEEEGGVNLYRMVENDGVNDFDLYGLACSRDIQAGHNSTPGTGIAAKSGYNPRTKKVPVKNPSCGYQGCGANAINTANGSTWMKPNAYPHAPGAPSPHPPYAPEDFEDAADTASDLKDNIKRAIDDICADCKCTTYTVTWTIDPGWRRDMEAHNKKVPRRDRIKIPDDGSKSGNCPKKK